MAMPSGSVSGPSAGAPRLRLVSGASVERDNARFLESAMLALLGSIGASRVQVLKDYADLEDRARRALDLAGRVRGAVEAGGSAAGAPRASVERDVAEIHGVLAGRAGGAHLSIASSAAATVEAALRVAGAASERSLSADL